MRGSSICAAGRGSQPSSSWPSLRDGAYWAIQHASLDALPDQSDTQVIVYTDWLGRSPDLVEDQITYPISSTLLAAPQVKSVRGFSFLGSSFIYVIFKDGTDIYWARSRVLEYLQAVRGKIPADVNPVLGPDASGVGWGFCYALVDEKGERDPSEMRSLQDYNVKLALESVPGVAQVASIGGFVKQYQIAVDPNRLLAYGIPINKVFEAISKSNSDIEGRVIEFSGAEYVVRGRGYIRIRQGSRDRPRRRRRVGDPGFPEGYRPGRPGSRDPSRASQTSTAGGRWPGASSWSGTGRTS